VQILLVFRKNLAGFDVIHFNLCISKFTPSSARHAERASMQSAPRLGWHDAEAPRECGDQRSASFAAVLTELDLLETTRQTTRFVVIFWALQKSVTRALTDFYTTRSTAMKYAIGG
jgi:hypothetical protein